LRIADGVVVQRRVIGFNDAERRDVAANQVSTYTLDDKLKLGVVVGVGIQGDSCLSTTIGVDAARGERARPGKLLGGRVVIGDGPTIIGALHHLDVATGGGDILIASALGVRLQLEQPVGVVAARRLTDLDTQAQDGVNFIADVGVENVNPRCSGFATVIIAEAIGSLVAYRCAH
jgi:hypothetical protein